MLSKGAIRKGKPGYYGTVIPYNGWWIYQLYITRLQNTTEAVLWFLLQNNKEQ